MSEEKKRKKKKQCEFCGYDRNPVALMFHHQKFIVKPSGKEREMLEKGKTYTLCANCHYILHNMLFGRKAGAEILEEQQTE